MSELQDEEGLLRSVALKNANSIFATRQREEELRARLAAIIESSEDAIIGLSVDGRVTSWNGGAGPVAGRSPPPLHELFFTRDRRGTRAASPGQP